MKKNNLNLKFIYALSLLACLTVSTRYGYGAVGCTLNDPDRDIKRIFPEATGFKTEFITIEEKGDDELEKRLEDLLEDKLDQVYETSDVPYAYYTVLNGRKTIGYVHGVNQKGKFGGMQIILATETNGSVVDFYFQKISSPEARKFMDKSFAEQFKNLSIKDVYAYRQSEAENREESRIGKIHNPTEKSEHDFAATLRGFKKNLFLLNEFKLKETKDNEK